METVSLSLWNAPRAEAPVVATVALPGSKSITNRALILAALADGPSTVTGTLRSRDTNLMLDALADARHRRRGAVEPTRRLSR